MPMPRAMRAASRPSRAPRMRVLVGLGSNIDAARNLADAIGRLAALGTVVRASRAWRTPPLDVAGGVFLNAAVLLDTRLAPGELRRRLRRVEEAMGRPARHDPWAARPIDLDLLAARDGGADAVGGGRWIALDHKLGKQPFQLLPALELVPELRLSDGGLAADALRERPLPGARPMEKSIFQLVGVGVGGR